MDFTHLSEAGRHGLESLTADPAGALVGFDFDGTLAPIVDDPTQAAPADGAIDALSALAARVGHVAIVTGRPAQLVVDLAGLGRHEGLSGLVVLGLYGLQRWDASTGAVSGPTTIDAVERAKAEVPDLVAEHGHPDAWIEDKGLSVAVHTRRLPDAQVAFGDLKGPLVALAERLGLASEPGRMVVELRPEGMDKGAALAGLVREFGSTSVSFVGDDLGDIAAFDEVIAGREQGRPGLLICSGSDEVEELRERADLVVEGPAGVVEAVRRLTAMIDAR